jgi:hypothetical protein
MAQQAYGQLNEFHGNIVNTGGTLVAGATFNLSGGGHVFIDGGRMLGGDCAASSEVGHAVGERPKELLDTDGLCLLSLGEYSCTMIQLFCPMFAAATLLSVGWSKQRSPGNGANGYFVVLDDSGVNGLATLYVLRDLMTKVNGERTKASLSLLKPFEVFDLIGGTGLGG